MKKKVEEARAKHFEISLNVKLIFTKLVNFNFLFFRSVG